MKRAFLLPLLLGALLTGAVPAGAGSHVFRVDPVHSEVAFRIRHLTGRVTGHFGDFTGEVRLDPDDVAGTLAITGTVRAASVDTGNDRRDDDLRSERFFEVETYPEMTLVSRSVEKTDDGLRMIAALTIRDVTKDVPFDVTFHGVMTHPRTGLPVTGIALEGTIDRKDFGVVWNQTLDTGGVLLGDDVQIDIQLEAGEQPEAAQK